MKAFFLKIQSFFMMILALFGIVKPTTPVEPETPPVVVDTCVEQIQNNLYDALKGGEISLFVSASMKDVDELYSFAKENPEGEIFFTDLDETPFFKTHLERTAYLAKLYAKETDSEKKSNLADFTFKCLRYYLNHNADSSNWWYNDIYAPNLLGEACILLRDVIPENLLSDVLVPMSMGCPENLSDYSGANATDLAMSTIKYATFIKDKELIKKARGAYEREMNYSGWEGLQADNSFFQHGKRIYFGDYGMNFIKGVVKGERIFRGTEFAFTSAELGTVSDYVLKGLRKVSFGSTLDPTVQGRSISRSSGGAPLTNNLQYIKALAKIDGIAHSEELNAFCNSIENNTKADYGLSYFDKAKFITINNSDFYFSFRGGESYLYYGETLNGENILAYNTSYPGVTTIMGSGNEYTDIFPLLDYSMIPGTTAVHETDEELLLHADWNKRKLSGTFFNKCENGIAISSSKTSHEGIDMTVTCVATDKYAVLLGAGMKNDNSTPMNTTLNQCFYNGSYTKDGNTVIHSGVKYTVLQGDNLNVDISHRKGNYKRINSSTNTRFVEGDVITISLSDSESYAYTVMSESTSAEPQLIVNNENLQAVALPDGHIAAVFFSAGSFTWNGQTYSSDVAQAVIY